MAEITLDPIVNRYGGITRLITLTIIGTDLLDVKAGWNLEVPNTWTLQHLKAVLTTDATVANRYIRVTHVVDSVSLNAWSSAAITASSTSNMAFVRENTPVANVSPEASKYLGLGADSYLIQGNDYIRIDVNTGKAGDTLEIICLMRWRNWDYGLLLPQIQRKRKE